MPHIAALVAAGHEVVITHGNGPQVGNLLVKNELAAAVVPPVPLDWCDAQTQGTIGALIMNALGRSLRDRGLPPRVAALVSRTLVDPADPAFAMPTKPIGRYLPRARPPLLIEHGADLAGPRRARAGAGSSPRPSRWPAWTATRPGAARRRVRRDLRRWRRHPRGGRRRGGYRGRRGRHRQGPAPPHCSPTALDADVLIIATDVEAAMLDWETPAGASAGPR